MNKFMLIGALLACLLLAFAAPSAFALEDEPQNEIPDDVDPDEGQRLDGGVFTRKPVGVSAESQWGNDILEHGQALAVEPKKPLCSGFFRLEKECKTCCNNLGMAHKKARFTCTCFHTNNNYLA